ncbi:mechanosensitive ion channel family protein [Vibrio vulnificus]|uniref:mechanosensitive ion channel family protein n=1 Tax=Vibrio vulnificus TaxID=672 RepID=UPI00102C1D46|nr:mechanosensitive ion channel domain-containing protein [Vibrio vulnificus]EIE1227957.1 mechanosensitive ion channel [Vibrio vulnificus]EJS4046552.1 mechanosensitive ion channel [Vibrio vulnificus]RZQ82140.1 mechanosensitive ion channel [Vibrio vulnificus]HDY7809440.1 mechanosensitive ion channel [Vibrio vulnificus]HDY7869239.1 mechanosensitive ion channel [Vibrio vulnificus]
MNTILFQAISIFLLFFIVSLVFDKLLKKVESKFDSSASELFRLFSNSQKAVLIFIGTFLALSKLGFEIGTLVASLGLTGFALGFALKDAISNLVAGIMLALYKPIKLGDTVEITGSKGVVVDLNLRYITIKAGGMTHLIPNSLLLNNKLSIVEEKN